MLSSYAFFTHFLLFSLAKRCFLFDITPIRYFELFLLKFLRKEYIKNNNNKQKYEIVNGFQWYLNVYIPIQSY